MRLFFRYLSLICSFISTINGYSYNYAAWSEYIQGVYDQLEMTGLGIAVVQNDSIIYQSSFGYSQLPTDSTPGRILKNDDLFRIASISKTFIATTILQLEEEGKLLINDNASDYLDYSLKNPYYPESPITIFHLLTHLSSINDSQSTWDIDKLNPESQNYSTKCFSSSLPGKEFKYCNLNYNLLGAIIENITGENLSNVIKVRILNPLNLSGSYDLQELDSNKFVKLYRYQKDTKTYQEETKAYVPAIKINQRDYRIGKDTGGYLNPAGGMKMSTGDLANYMIMHINSGRIDEDSIISEEDENRMRKNYVGKNDYGLSFKQYKDIRKNYTFYGQTGGAYGLRSAMIFEPINKIGFIIISSGSKSQYINGYGDIHKPIIQRIVKDLLP